MSQTKAQLVSPIGILTAIGINVSGVVTAIGGFEGDGSRLTGIRTNQVSISTSLPVDPRAGDLWYNPTYARTFVWYDESLVGIGTTASWVDSSPFNNIDISNINTTGIITASRFSSTNGFNIDGDLTVNGDVTAVNFRSTSDISLKENVNDIENSLEIVSQLRGVSFNWKESGDKSYGVIAQELEEVLPELVSNTNPKTVYYDALIGILIESIKDLKLELEAIKNSK